MISLNMAFFLRDWLKWAETGEQLEGCDDLFDSRYGLCSNLEDYGFAHGFDDNESCRLDEELGALFRADGLDDSYPFGGHSRYSEDSKAHAMHKNEDRAAWVRAKLEDRPAQLQLSYRLKAERT